MLDAAASDFAREPAFVMELASLLAEGSVVHRAGIGGRSYILPDSGAPRRIWLRTASVGASFAAFIPFDDMTETRIQAVHDFARWLQGVRSFPPAASTTFYQARRLDLLLAILGLRADAGVTSHEVARRLVYPGMTIGRGAAWKASPERRRTQRLIREAEALAAGGYRALLRGRPGRQK